MREERIAKVLSIAFDRKTKKAGRYEIALTDRQEDTLNSRQMSLFVMHLMDWVEDASRLILDAACNTDGSIYMFFGMCYPKEFSGGDRLIRQEGERKTLLYRLHYLLRALAYHKAAERASEWHQWHITGCQETLSTLAYAVGQIVGAERIEPFNEFRARFFRLFTCENTELTTPAQVEEELRNLGELIDRAFEAIREGVRKRDAEIDAKASEKGELAKVAEQMKRNNDIEAGKERSMKKAVNCLSKVVTERWAPEPADPYSQMTGLERCNAAQKRELMAAFKVSHERFPVDRSGKDPKHSLRALARRVWEDNKVEFEALAKLTKEPGYKNADSLAVKLCKLAKTYPSADHFRWM